MRLWLYIVDRGKDRASRARRGGPGEGVNAHRLCHNRSMKLVDSTIALEDLSLMAESGFGNLVKAVVDTEREIMAVDAELHSDEEALLLEDGSQQAHLWGINIYPDLAADERIEFDSMINIRPSQGNRSRGVDDPEIRARIVRIVESLVRP
jgi:hypothetical protein